jgi:hyperosmotically inducible protein
MNRRIFMKNAIVAAMIAVTTVWTAGCAVSSGQSSVGEYVDDATVTAQVKAKMAQDTAVAATRIQVETLKGVVQLSGFATSEAERTSADQIAAGVRGVKQVQNAIEVRAPQG